MPKGVFGEEIIWHFGSVTHHAEVYLHGEKITECKGGFLPFKVKINDHLDAGWNRKGIFTRDRKPKMAAHYMKERWESIPHFNYKK